MHEQMRCCFRNHRLPDPYRSSALPAGRMRTCITFSNVSRLGSAVGSRNGPTSSTTLSQVGARRRPSVYLDLHQEYFVSLRRKIQRITGCVSARLRLQMQHRVPTLSWQAAANHAKWRRPP
jgi:hypothetical protein